MLNFQRIGDSLLFRLPEDDGTDGQSPGVLAFLYPQGGEPPEDITLRRAWQTVKGYLLFLEEIPDADKVDAFVDKAWSELSDRVEQLSLAWVLGDPNQPDGISVQPLGLRRQAQNAEIAGGGLGTTLRFRQLELSFPEFSPVLLENRDGDHPYFVFQNLEGQGIEWRPEPGADGVAVSETTLQLTGGDLGFQLFSLIFGGEDLDADRFDLSLRYFIPAKSDSSGEARSLRYPIFDLTGGETLALQARLDPVFWDDSSFTVEPSATGTLPSFFRTDDGDALSLTPRSGLRLYLSEKTIAGRSGRFAYLVPDGELELSATAGNNGGPAPQLLAGLAGTETLSITLSNTGTAGDVVAFYKRQRAYAPSFGSDEPQTGPLLIDTFTTSWVAVGPASSADGAGVAPAPNRYFAQPDGASLYSRSSPVGAGAGNPFNGFLELPAAILPAPGKDFSYPLTPLAGAHPDLEPDVDPDTYLAVEQGVVSPERKTRILDFTESARPLSALGAEEVVDGNTPQGLVAKVPSPGVQATEIGQWQELLLAVNPDDTASTSGTTSSAPSVLQITNLEAAFQNALQSSKLFLVVSQADLLGTFSNQISVGGWPFEIDIGAAAGAGGAGTDELDNVLIFKFYDETLETLVDEIGRWAQPDHFNGDPSAVQGWLQGFLEDARKRAKSDPELYGPFVDQVLDRPDWRGILALNVKIPVDKLPEEVRGLLGGIKQPDRFKAHHLGIEINRTDESGSAVNKSSLFALLDYRDDDGSEGATLDAADEDDTYDFTVKTLQILFANTEIKEFKSRVQVTLNELFDENTRLGGDSDTGDSAAGEDGDTNSIELEGSYERHESEDGTSQATYTFLYEGRKVFDITTGEILKKVEIDKVQFTTVSETPAENGKTEITSQFAFWGSLEFGSLTDFDFFSFDSLDFADLKLGMTFQAAGSSQVTDRRFWFDPGNLRFDVSFSQTRQDSLLGNFPLRLTGFVFNTREGQSVNDLGFLQVPDLIPGITPTDKPLYALTFSLDLGSMGELVSKTRGFAIELLAGWTPSGGGTGNQFAFGLKLPESAGGGKEIGIQGVLTLSVESFGFLKLPEDSQGGDFLYALYLDKSVLKILGTQIPPGLAFSTLLFVPFQNGTRPDLSNLGWFVAFTPTGNGNGTALTAGEGPVIDGRTGELVETETADETQVLKLDYLGLGQRIKLDTSDADAVVAVIDNMKKLIPADKKGEELREQLTQLYDRDAGWLIGVDLTLFQVMRLAVVFAEATSVYGLLIGFVDKAPEVLKGFQFQILYKKINDSVGVYKIALELPDQLRSQQFGAVGFTIPTIKVDIFTNGDFRLDVGFPDGLDFSSSFSVQAQAGPIPVIGLGGFFFANLSSATSSTVPQIPPEVGTFEPVLEAGFGLSLGVGKTIEKGIFRAGLTVTFVGILQGTVAWFNKADTPTAALPARGLGDSGGALAVLAALAPTFDGPPDFYRVQGQLALVGKLYGEVDFGIVKAGVSLTVWASLTITFEAYKNLDLEIAAGVSVKVTVVIGSFKIFGKKIEIKVSFSFSTRISATFTIEDNRTPPWGQVTGAEVARLGAAESLEPISWVPSQVVPDKQDVTLYFAPQVSVAVIEDDEKEEQLAQCIASLVIDNGDATPYFDTLLAVLLRWTLELAGKSGTDEIDKDFLETQLERLDLPVTLARTPAPATPLDYATLAEFLSLNFNPVTVAAQPPDSGEDVVTNEAGVPQTDAMTFPIIPDVGADFNGTSVEFWTEALRSVEYQEDLAEYFAQLLVNFEPRNGEGGALRTESGEVSVATTMFEDYFALIVKAGIGQAVEHVDVHGPQTVDDLLAGLAKSEGEAPSGLANVGAQASRFLLHGLRVPPEFQPTPADPQPLYLLDGQQFPIRLVAGEAWKVSLFARQDPQFAWFTLAEGEQAPELAISASDEDPGRQKVLELEKTEIPLEGISFEQTGNLLARAQEYTFRNDIQWTDAGTSGPTLWPYPGGLVNRLALDQAAGRANLGLVLRETRDGAPPTQVAVPAEGVDYCWSLQIPFDARQVPLGGGESGFVPKTYQVGGTDEAARALLEILLDQLDGVGAEITPEVEAFQLLFPPQQGTGLVSQQVDGSNVLLLKTNLSTESAAPTAALAAEEVPPADQFSALMLPAQAKSFLDLLWQVSILNAGGFYLYYENASQQGLPDYLFEGGRAAELTLLVTFKTQTKTVEATNYLNGQPYSVTVDEVGTYTNTLTVLSALDDPTVLYGEAPTVPTYSPALAVGSVGFLFERDDPETSLSAPAAVASVLGSAAGLTRDQVAAALVAAGYDPTRDEFRARMIEAGDDDAQLQNLFNLLTYGLDDNADFEATIRGVPVGPTEEPDQNQEGKWRYRQIIPVHPSAKEQLPPIDGEGQNPYSGVGGTAEIGLDLLDLFGNPILSILTEPLEPQPTSLYYFDPLLGLDVWPGLASSYRVQTTGTAGTGELTATLTLTRDGFVDGEGKVDKDAVRHAIDTYRQAGNQMEAPGYSARLTSTVAPGVDSADLTGELKSFVQAVLRFLDELLNEPDGPAPSGVASEPVVATLSYELSAQQRNDNQPQNIYEVQSSLVIERSRFVDPNSQGKLDSVRRVASRIPPFATTEKGTNGEQQEMALTEFARGFEAAFPELKAATGTGSTGDTTVWAVRMGEIAAGAPGITYEFTGREPLYYAPPPLSNTLQSRDIDVTFPDGPFQRNVAGVDMDVWGAAFLSAVDVFLEPQNAVPARQAAPEDFRRVMEAKETLAGAISSGVVHVLAGQSPSDDEQQAAREAFRQRLLVTLSSAYEIATVVQLQADVTNSRAPSPPPNLYGDVSGSETVSAAEDLEAPDFAFSPSKVALGSGDSLLTTLFSVQVPEKQSNVSLDLGYRVTHVEHDIEPAEGHDEFQASSWLTLILPQGVTDAGAADIPVALRGYPMPPTLSAQAAVAEALADCPKPDVELADDPLQVAKRWQLRFTYEQPNVRQDTVKPDVKFNLGPRVPSVALAAERPDLLDWLAKFDADYPALVAPLRQQDPGAISKFADLVHGVAGAWEAWGEPQAAAGHLPQAQAALAEYRYRYRMDELLDDSEIQVFWLPVEQPVPVKPTFPWIQLTVGDGEPQCLKPDLAPDHQSATYTYQGSQSDDPRLERTVILPGLDVLNTENGWGGIQLSRNEVLFPDDPAIQTNRHFVYQTPLVRFINKKTPLVDAGLAIDVGTAQPQPLVNILSELFQALFEGADAQAPAAVEGAGDRRVMRLNCRYAYDVRGVTGNAEGPVENAAFLVYLPVLDQPPFEFVLGTDWSPNDPTSFVGRLATAIETSWRQRENPSTSRAFLLFDLAVFAALSDIQLPVLQLRQLWLGIDKIEGWSDRCLVTS